MKEPRPGNLEGDRSFEEQFADKKQFKVAGGTAEVVDITPTSGETDGQVFFAPAWGCTLEVYKPALQTLVGENVRAISLDHPRRGGDMSSAPEEAVEKYPYETLRRALNITGVFEQKNMEKVDAIAHSAGASDVVVAAMLHSERFRNIILYGGAGLIGKDGFIRLMKGFAGQSKRAESLKGTEKFPEISVTETEKEVAAKAAKEALKYFAANPVRALKEAYALTDEKGQILDMLRYLHNEKGIGIGIIHAVDDPVFPMDKVQDMVKGDMIDGFFSVRGGHGEIGNHPERYMVAAKKMLDAIEKKKEERRRMAP
ncbi:MAG: alpha/beta hydrolase [Candidatus Liptonbacteria bacterium]|nr:alpha/beta hydrolase [Candidatus Liptonbacteria bacterium]